VEHSSHDPGYGWILFAAVLLMLLGTVNLIEGLAAVGGSEFFIRGVSYVAGTLHTWGWVITLMGTLEFILGVAVLQKIQLARWTGVVLLAGNVIVQLLLMPADPFWSLAVIPLAVLGIYGLVAHGAVIGVARQ
jgi:hypothetical protein